MLFEFRLERESTECPAAPDSQLKQLLQIYASAVMIRYAVVSADAVLTICARRFPVGGASAPRAGWPYAMMCYLWCVIAGVLFKFRLERESTECPATAGFAAEAAPTDICIGCDDWPRMSIMA